jgi:DNA-directed RNA polymerase subunit alpha
MAAISRVRLSDSLVRRRDMERKLGMSMAELGLSVRTTNCLEEQGIHDVEALLKKKSSDLLGISNFGEKTLDEVYDRLESHGFLRRSRTPVGTSF